MEVEYLVTCVATQEVIWLYHLSLNMGVPQHHPMIIYGDNQNVIKFFENTKISIDNISIDNQVANIIAKSLLCEIFIKFLIFDGGC
jgi:hypothetical protein